MVCGRYPLKDYVPQHWYGHGLFGRSVETYPLSPFEQQKHYSFDPSRMVTIQLPSHAKLTTSQSITAYQLAGSFEAILENTTTGQRYPLSGKWIGILALCQPLCGLTGVTI